MILTSARCTPSEGECAQRGERTEGRGCSTSAQREGSGSIKVRRTTMESLEFEVSAGSTAGGQETVSRINVVTCYAPTRAASREDRDTFFQELNNIISGVPAGETYIILGDFKARVGSRKSDDNEGGHTGSGQSMMLGKRFCPFSFA